MAVAVAVPFLSVVSDVKGVFCNSKARIPQVYQHQKGKYIIQSKMEETQCNTNDIKQLGICQPINTNVKR